MAEAGIATAVHYPMPLHCEPVFEGRHRRATEALPVAVKLCGTALGLPVHASLDRVDMERIVDAMRRACG